MNRETIRYQNDREMAAELLGHPDVVRVNQQLEKMEEAGPLGTRRRLLGTSVRLSRSMAPEIHAMADECIEKLEMKIPHELYVYSSPQYNAACFKPEAGKLFVMFSSSLLEKFDGSELKFVIGHEFGHHVYNHHDDDDHVGQLGLIPRGNGLAKKGAAVIVHIVSSAMRLGGGMIPTPSRWLQTREV